MKLLENLNNFLGPSLGFLANLFTVILGFLSLWKIINFTKAQRSSKNDVSNSFVDNSNTTINYYGYYEENFTNYGSLTDDQIDNYNYASEKIWKFLYFPTIIIVILYIVQYWLSNPIHLTSGIMDQTINSSQLLFQTLIRSLAESLRQTFNLTWLAQFIVSVLVILKMALTKNILYRKINIILYNWSLIFTWYLMDIFSKFSFKNTTFAFIPAQTPNLSLENFKPIFTIYLVAVLFIQLIYTIYILYSGIRILRIGELYYYRNRTQAKKVWHKKTAIAISPILLYFLWYLFSTYIA